MLANQAIPAAKEEVPTLSKIKSEKAGHPRKKVEIIFSR